MTITPLARGSQDRVGLGSGRDGPRFSKKGHHGAKKATAFLVVGVLCLLLLVYAGSRLGGFFRLQEVRIEGCTQVPPATVIDILALDHHPSLVFLDLSLLARRLLGNPWVREVSFARLFPHTLVVRIEERKPSCILEGPNRLLVSHDGTVLSPLEGETVSKFEDLPSLRLEVGRVYRPGEKIDLPLFDQDKGECFWRQLPQSLCGSSCKIQEIRCERDGSVTVCLGTNAPLLKLRPELLEEQLPRLQTVLSQAHLDWEGLEYIDLRFSRKIILRPLGKGGGAIGPG